MTRNVLIIISIAIIVMVCNISACKAVSIDLSWSVPENIEFENSRGNNSVYLVWRYSVKNLKENAARAPINIFLNTDTDIEVEDVFNGKLIKSLSERDKIEKKYDHATTIQGDIAPNETKNCLAIFENVDPDAKKVYIYIMGLRRVAVWRSPTKDNFYRITYKRSSKLGWRLIEHGFFKDTASKYKPFY